MRRLVASLPRAGTTYISQLLRNAGYKVAREHEDVENDIRVSWLHVAYGQAASGYVEPSGWDVIVHVVREPMATIGSLTTISSLNMGYMLRWVGLPYAGAYEWKIHRAMWAYWKWNEQIEPMVSHRYRVEDMPESLYDLVYTLRIEQKVKAFEDPLHDLNTRKHQEVTWDMCQDIDPFLTVRLREMAERYGYDTSA